jgi:hypothetical protein
METLSRLKDFVKKQIRDLRVRDKQQRSCQCIAGITGADSTNYAFGTCILLPHDIY